MKTMQEAKAKFASKQLSREAQRAVMGGGQFETCRANGFSAEECCLKAAAGSTCYESGCPAGLFGLSFTRLFTDGRPDSRIVTLECPGGDLTPICDLTCGNLDIKWHIG